MIKHLGGRKLGRTSTHRRALIVQSGHQPFLTRANRDVGGEGQRAPAFRRTIDHAGQDKASIKQVRRRSAE